MKIKLVNKSNFNRESLNDFDRFQVVNNIYKLVDGRLVLAFHPFTETWSPERKHEKADEILSGEYITYCAFDDERVVGEIMIVPELNQNRLIIDSFHVSGDFRRQGVGRALFQTVAEKAREMGAEALYMSACSAEETIRFYLAMGCKPSENPIPEYAEAEPFDIQMECKL